MLFQVHLCIFYQLNGYRFVGADYLPWGRAERKGALDYSGVNFANAPACAERDVAAYDTYFEDYLQGHGRRRCVVSMFIYVLYRV